ncbi:MAG: response regulator transcription factor [Terriglobales bacterium]
MTLSQREFSKRERQIVYALTEAKTVKDIAREMDLSVNTVKDYIKNIYRKAEVHSARELMRQYHSTHTAPLDTGLAQLLQSAQRLSAEAAPAEALVQLHAAVRTCTRARRVTFWHWLRSGNELYLAGDTGSTRSGSLLHLPCFAGQLRTQGWARLQAQEMGGLEGRELAAHGLVGEAIAVECAPTPRVQVLLAGDPAEGHFGALDAAIMRLLVRLQHAQPSSGLEVLRASA